MTSDLPTGAIEAAVRSLFPAEVAVAAERIGVSTEADLWPEERVAIAGAVPARLSEFCAGRFAARRALAALGLRPTALPMRTDRAPLWPTGIAGSIAHAHGFAIAVARHGPALGVDIEADAPLDADLWPVICDSAELGRLPTIERGRHVRCIFSAKESVFKAQDPGQRAMFGFDTVSVTLANDAFDAQFCRDAGAFRAGQVVPGRLARIQGLVLAGVAT
jgi:4'-phosphopantetheinyl transferase EntD